MKKQNIKRLLGAVFFVAVFAATVFAVFYGQDPHALLEALVLMDLRYLLPGICCVMAYILADALLVYYMLRTLRVQACFRHCCCFSFIGFFFCCITPSASGGQPMQVLYMRRYGIPAAVSTVVLAIITIIYKLVLVMIGLGVLLLRPAAVMEALAPVEWVMYVGIAINVICVAVLLALVFWPALFRQLLTGSFRLANKLLHFSNHGKLLARFDRAATQYEGAAEYYRSHKLVILNVFIITLAQRLVLFFVTWLTYRAFALSGHGIPLVVTLQAMISVAADVLPTPGGMGFSEGLFLSVFPGIFGEEFVLPAMIVSRGISYYTQLIISAVMTAVSLVILRRREKRKIDAFK